MSFDIESACHQYQRWGRALVPTRLTDAELSELRTSARHFGMQSGVIGKLHVGVARVHITSIENPVIAQPTMQVRWPQGDDALTLGSWRPNSGWCGALGVSELPYAAFRSYVEAARAIYIECGMAPGMLEWVELLESVVSSLDALVALVPDYGSAAAVGDHRAITHEFKRLMSERGFAYGRVAFYARTIHVGGRSFNANPISFYTTEAVRYLEHSRRACAQAAAITARKARQSGVRSS